ncbi:MULTISPECIES: dihydropteroate synthase [unclassified Sphingomonas]|jgi:dihydropteroate synthase|uniref:dihydropteroate synthase n=1 Tax=Sphingomonas TaxID=13687 RepID=UPI00095E1947|nr:MULTISPECIES: dihydropteroate synthase [unclassified Sphingomonas]MBN8809901.1 dihydropteroate synthase [Sphingomonas sp.]OJY50511.1 MAG: dihydropteroate synthase [Sphingomonas sp. 67-41]
MTLDLPASAKLYLRPVQLADSPVDRDGELVRLAGGLSWCSAVELIAREKGKRVLQRTVAIADLPEDPRIVAILERIAAPRAPLALGPRIVRLDQPQVMAILNRTPDSFSDAGTHMQDADAAASAGVDMAAAGAAILDIGGESTRPGAAEIWEGEEIERVVPVIRRLARGGAAISVDTRRAAVMAAALQAGAHLVNDVAALLHDPGALEVVVAAGCPVVLMHSPEPQKGPHGGEGYGDVLLDVYDWLEKRVEDVAAAGVDRARILVDPGIGFGKSLQDNLALLNGLALFHGIGCGLVLGASRKRMIGALSNEAPADLRLGGSLALALKGADAGVQLIRVHDVFETVQALRVWRGLRDAALIAR